ncbi:hypothetical protein EN784_01435 [bacterium M00.F.Ca.ET.141.01.1.1]|nr:hypothetical protein EN784_01435 [bacterium M00.F.Ca.ET.141.01.1.1]
MNATNKLSFKASTADLLTVRKIARRARDLHLAAKVDRDALDIQMDLLATHASGCPMDFDRLLAADDFNLMHDVSGIARHLDRDTGELTGYFLPRFAAKQSVSA